MNRSELRDKFLKDRTNESKIAYTKKRNVYISLLCKSKRDYLVTVDTKIMKDSKKLW